MALIRRADPLEARALASLHRGSIVAHCSAAYSAEQINAWIGVIQPETYTTLIDDGKVLAATEDVGGSLLGVGVCSAASGLINAAYVAPGRTRRGAGRALMNVMESLLLDACAHEARLNATLNSVAFYRSLGYRNEVPTVNRLPSGIELPCVAMSKPLV